MFVKLGSSLSHQSLKNCRVSLNPANKIKTKNELMQRRKYTQLYPEKPKKRSSVRVINVIYLIALKKKKE